MTARIIAFPASHWLSEIREAARRVLALHGAGADIYWRELIVGMQAKMDAAQVEPQEAERQLRAFAECVLWEIRSTLPDRTA